MSPDRYRLSPEDHQRIFERRIVRDLFVEPRAAESPKAIVFGGQPGAGKSEAVGRALNELSKESSAIAIVGDDFRAYHPKYAELLRKDDRTAAFYTDRDTALWVEKSIAHALALRAHVVIEGTMRNPDKVASTLSDFRRACYQTEARVLAVPPRLSALGIAHRYELQRANYHHGRLTLPEAHQAALDGMPKTIERIEHDRLADTLTIEHRDGSRVYANRLAGDRWQAPTGAVEAMRAEHARPLASSELHQLRDGYAVVAALMKNRGASATERQAANAESERATRELGMSRVMGHDLDR